MNQVKYKDSIPGNFGIGIFLISPGIIDKNRFHRPFMFYYVIKLFYILRHVFFSFEPGKEKLLMVSNIVSFFSLKTSRIGCNSSNERSNPCMIFLLHLLIFKSSAGTAYGAFNKTCIIKIIRHRIRPGKGVVLWNHKFNIVIIRNCPICIPDHVLKYTYKSYLLPVGSFSCIRFILFFYAIIPFSHVFHIFHQESILRIRFYFFLYCLYN